jgi:hypothetical protein
MEDDLWGIVCVWQQVLEIKSRCKADLSLASSNLVLDLCSLSTLVIYGSNFAHMWGSGDYHAIYIVFSFLFLLFTTSDNVVFS